jgi:hypothetical protein
MARRPDFEELVAKAGGKSSLPKRKPWWNSTSRLAWAASLMLAVGAGWLGRELLIQTGQDMPTVVAESEAIPQAPAQTAALRDALEEDEAAADQDRARAEAEDGEPAAGERHAPGIAAPPPDEPEVAMMQKSEGQKAVKEVRQDDVSRDASGDRLEAVAEPLGERDAVARLVGDGATFPACYVAEDHLAGVPVLGPQELRLLADGTAAARTGEAPMAGTWLALTVDSVQVLLVSGGIGMEMRFERTATGLSGTAVSSTRTEALNEADTAGAGPGGDIQYLQIGCESVL